MGQRLLILSSSSTVAAGSSSVSGTVTTSTDTEQGSIEVVTLPSDPGYIWKVQLGFNISTNDTGMNLSFSTNTAKNAIPLQIISDAGESFSFPDTADAEVEVGPGTTVSISWAYNGTAPDSFDYDIVYSAIGKKIINDSF
jgi:hypothetical protein